MPTHHDPATCILFQRSEELLERSAVAQAKADAASRYVAEILRAIPTPGIRLATAAFFSDLDAAVPGAIRKSRV